MWMAELMDLCVLLFDIQTRKPRKFDFDLPDISLEDLQYLKSSCPYEVQPFLR